LGGVVTRFGGPVTIVFCTEDLPEKNSVRLAAAVLWRPGSPRPLRGWRGLFRKLQFWLSGLGPGGIHLRSAEYWSGSTRPDGAQLTLFHESGKLVKVLGRKYAVPGNGGTLVLLVDENDPRSAPRISSRTVPTPLARVSKDSFTDLDSWVAALRGDADVRGFMAEAATNGAA